MRGSTKQIALCGILAALSITVLFFGTVIEVLDLTSVAVACFLVYIVSVMYGYKWGISQYLSITILSAIFLNGKFAFLAFISVGLYPVCKNFFDYKIKNKALKWFLKLLLFNIGFTILLFIGRNFLFLPDSTNKRIIIEILIAYLISNAFIILYDFVCDKMIIKYGRIIFKLLK
jgi:hypothetical protein